MKKLIQPSEWVLVGSLFLIMASLVFISKINASRAFSAISEKDLKKEEISVAINGAVAKPGRYKISSGSTVGEVLRKAKPLPDANLRTISKNQVLEESTEIQIESLQEIVVWVSGAVMEVGAVRLSPKARICDLKSKVSLTPEGDKSFFKRKKMLRDGDRVEVPKKTVEVNSAY